MYTGGEGDDRGWDGWMVSRTWWTWVWVNSGNWWWTGRPGVLQFTGSQRVGHDWTTELNWTELKLRAWFFEKINITIDITEIQSILRDHHEQLLVNKLGHLEDVSEFLETYNLPRLSHEETENMYRPFTSKEFESVIKTPWTANKAPH